ncbi:hypothetical protein EV186_105302 [Labedaea rhizosphaerae]|uniref:Uncharacterized protein n=2 Tax=Labedaea rhizosphaerae TaxID=598644 RepID=A0A4R6S5Q3_LABRH|nr:hypothetical protein EV186_105302 [Labedaea rhizosphaerae]
MSWRSQPRDKNGRWTKGLSAGALALVVGGGAIAAEGGLGATVSGGGVPKSVVDRAAKGKEPARKGNRDLTWRRMNLKRLKQIVKHGLPCAANSYGEVHKFFLRTPCRSLDRFLVRLDDGNGGEMIVSVSWVRMRSSRSATKLRSLADTYGTGNVSPLPGALVGAGRVKWTGRYYHSRPSGSMVVIAEVEPVHGVPDPDFMKEVAAVAAEFPRP